MSNGMLSYMLTAEFELGLTEGGLRQTTPVMEELSNT